MIPATIQRAQRERLACVYVRQSTPLQVRQHHESTERQYALRERAVALGWPPSAVEVIDEDQGRSGASAAHRPGFQRLVSRVGLGEVGLVLMLEASRLARSSSEWHRLIELCGLADALIADEGAVYDPRDPNDRLLLGVKGTLSEAELFTLRLRLHEGRWNKARKGLLAFPLPVGYVRGDDGNWELDPDAQVRERLAYLFATFQRVGVARAVVRELTTLGLTLPTRVTAREGYGTLTWKAPTLSAVVRVLANLALTVLDEHFEQAWRAMGSPAARQWRRHKGQATYRLVRYADDFVILVSGTRAQAEALRDEAARVLAPMGLRLSAEKTRIAHIDEGFDFLGFRIVRQRKRGTQGQRVIYTYPAKKAVAALKAQVRSMTRTAYDQPLAILLHRVNRVLRGWATYFRHGVSKATFDYVGQFTWSRVLRWLHRKHQHAGWTWLRRRYLPRWWPTDGEVILLRPSTITVSRYRYRGRSIPSPWTAVG